MSVYYLEVSSTTTCIQNNVSQEKCAMVGMFWSVA